MQKFNYIVDYVDFNGMLHTILINATDCQDLLNQIAERLPEDAAYILSVSTNNRAKYWVD